MEQSFWRKCSDCKSEIGFNTVYYKCSVSSCSKKRAPVQFCSVSCWDSHNAMANHMSAGADEYKSPSYEKWKSEQDGGESRRRIVAPKKASTPTPSGTDIPRDVLVVVSKMKAYVQAAHGLNTSGDVADMLSDIIREHCDRAQARAKADGRKTLMARDF